MLSRHYLFTYIVTRSSGRPETCAPGRFTASSGAACFSNQLALLLLQPERPCGALLQVHFGLLQGGRSLLQRRSDLTDFDGKAGFGIQRPPGLLAVILLQGGNLRSEE